MNRKARLGLIGWLVGIFGTAFGADGPPQSRRDQRRETLAAIHAARAKLPSPTQGVGPDLDSAARRQLIELAASFQELPVGRGDQVRFARALIDADKDGFDAIRFRTPPGAAGWHLGIEVVFPTRADAEPVRTWNILVTTGEGPSIGREIARRANLDVPGVGLPAANVAVARDLTGPVAPGAEYLIWFDLKEGDALPIFVKLRLTPVTPPEPPQTLALKQARATHIAAQTAAERKYDTERASLGKTYAAALAGSLRTPASSAEADRIRAELDELRRGERGAAGHRGFRVIRAGYGVDERWVDVTRQIRALVRGDVLRFNTDPQRFKPDPAYGTRKTLLIVYSLDGNVFTSITRESDRVELPPVPAARDRIDPAEHEPGSAEPPVDPPTTPALQSARATFQAGLAGLSERYDGEVKALRRLYLTELDKVAQQPSTQKDRAEADRISAEVDRANGGDATTESPRGLRVVRAEYGEGDRWMDVTIPLRAYSRGSFLTFDPRDRAKYGFKPDPSYGTRKTLIILYAVDGVPGVSMTPDDHRVDLPRRPGGTKR